LVVLVSFTVLAYFYPNLDPVAFRIGPLAVRWYGIAYLLGFAASYFALLNLIKRGRLRVARASLADLVTYLAVGVVVGGRTGWWLFYHRPGGTHDAAWYEPLAIWHGGMSFHGGLLGVCIALAVWCWWRGASFWNVADCLTLVAPVGLFFGRIANFINAELVGRPAAVPWAVFFPGELVPRHPSQIYEALLEGPVLLVCMWIFARRPRPDGMIAATFLLLYGGFRFAMEFTREPDGQLGFVALGWVTMGQVLSLVTGVAGVALAVIASARSKTSDCAAAVHPAAPGALRRHVRGVQRCGSTGTGAVARRAGTKQHARGATQLDVEPATAVRAEGGEAAARSR
jgi:phosphatidylglycerol:prolipoprotein diacylglycerol transferase